MEQPVDLQDYERLAPAHMSAMAWEFLSSGAGDEHTMGWNHGAYQRLRLMPRHLVDVSRIDTAVTVLGRAMPHPILLAPVAYQRLLRPEGELAAAEGAGAAGATMILSSFSTIPLEEVAAAALRPLWLQLYVHPQRDVTGRLLRRAQDAGYEAVVLTVDTPVLGARSREARAKFELPAGMEKANFRDLPGGATGHRPKGLDIYSGVLDPSLTWRDVDWIRSQTKLPVLLKGVLNPDDAGRAVEAGASGLIVSNHGGRVLDTVPATIDALPAVVERVAGRVPVLVDGGIRRGTDVLKALACGASAVCIGRPYAYGLAVSGAGGVAHVVNLLRRELEMAMALTGRTSVASIDASVLLR